MSSQEILAFIMSRPFVPFVATLIGGRQIVVQHSDFVAPAFAGFGFWLLHESGHVEAIAGEAIITMITLSPTDPQALIG